MCHSLVIAIGQLCFVPNGHTVAKMSIAKIVLLFRFLARCGQIDGDGTQLRLFFGRLYGRRRLRGHIQGKLISVRQRCSSSKQLAGSFIQCRGRLLCGCLRFLLLGPCRNCRIRLPEVKGAVSVCGQTVVGADAGIVAAILRRHALQNILHSRLQALGFLRLREHCHDLRGIVGRNIASLVRTLCGRRGAGKQTVNAPSQNILRIVGNLLFIFLCEKPVCGDQLRNTLFYLRPAKQDSIIFFSSRPFQLHSLAVTPNISDNIALTAESKAIFHRILTLFSVRMQREIAGYRKSIFCVAWILRNHRIHFILRDKADLDRLKIRVSRKYPRRLSQFLQRPKLAHRGIPLPSHKLRICGVGRVEHAHFIRNGFQSFRRLQRVQNALRCIREPIRRTGVQVRQHRHQFLDFRTAFGILHHVPQVL